MKNKKCNQCGDLKHVGELKKKGGVYFCVDRDACLWNWWQQRRQHPAVTGSVK